MSGLFYVLNTTFGSPLMPVQSALNVYVFCIYRSQTMIYLCEISTYTYVGTMELIEMGPE
jgi:hypothetical protein